MSANDAVTAREKAIDFVSCDFLARRPPSLTLTGMVSTVAGKMYDFLKNCEQPKEIGCEICEHTGRTDCLPDDGTHTHPCDTCRPAENAEFNRGYEFALYEIAIQKEDGFTDVEKLAEKMAVCISDLPSSELIKLPKGNGDK